MRGRRLDEETVVREAGSMEVRLAKAAEQSRKVSKEEEDAIRSGEATRYKISSQPRSYTTSKLRLTDPLTDGGEVFSYASSERYDWIRKRRDSGKEI